ncbi:MAG: diguanylate cyclase [Pseudomonadota bacterium]
MQRLLIVEDDEALRQVLRRTFAPGYEVIEAVDGLDGLEQARAMSPVAVISDQRMPRLSGVEMLSQIKEFAPYCVRVLVTGYDDYGAVVDAVNAAKVHHYFEKPFHPHHMRTVVDALVHAAELEVQRDNLTARLSESVEQLEQANRALRESESSLSRLVDERTGELQQRNTELLEANRKLQDLAVRDGLTGLFNHRYLVEHLEMELARSQRYGRQFCLLFVDVDDFKRVNDSLGHQVGDAALCAIAEVFKPSSAKGLRQSDFTARYGGEEFCILLPETALDGGRIKAERLRQAVEQHPWSEVARDLDRPLTVSIGVSGYPEHGESIDSLLKHADRAPYQAKEMGKNRIVLAPRTSGSASTS